MVRTYCVHTYIYIIVYLFNQVVKQFFFFFTPLMLVDQFKYFPVNVQNGFSFTPRYDIIIQYDKPAL